MNEHFKGPFWYAGPGIYLVGESPLWGAMSQEGIHVGKIEIAQSLYQAGILTVEQIEKFTGVSRIDFAMQLA